MAGIYKRGKTYYARMQRKGVDHRTSLETTDRRVAQRRFEQWKERLEALSWGERPRITLAEAMKQFTQQHVTTLKPNSMRRYVISMAWLGSHFEGKYLDELDRAALGSFEEARRSAGASPPTVRRDLACLSSLMGFCEDKDWIDEGRNPVPGFLRRRAKRGLKENKGRNRWLTVQEEATILDFTLRVKVSKGPLREAIMLAIDTGFREQEQFSLQWSQVDLLNNIILTTKDTKNGRVRAVPIPSRSAQFLAQWKELNKAQKVPSVYVFAKKNGKRYRNLYRGFKVLLQKAKIPDACWHDLRRTAGCRWLKQYGKSMHEVSMLLGHGSVTVTEKSYAFLDQVQLAIDTAAQNPAQVGEHPSVIDLKTLRKSDGH